VSAEEVEIRRCVLALIKQHGWSSTSVQILEPRFRYWSTATMRASVTSTLV